MAFLIEERKRLISVRDNIDYELNKIKSALAAIPPPLPYTDIQVKYHMTRDVEKNVIEGKYVGLETHLTGGRRHSEYINPGLINGFATYATPRVNASSREFFERIGIKDPRREVDFDEFVRTTPYSYVKNNGRGIATTVDDNVLINKERRTVLKFLRSRRSIGNFLMSVYISAGYADLLGCAKCIAFYPDMLCAEYEYAGESVRMVLENLEAQHSLGQLRRVKVDEDALLREEIMYTNIYKILDNFRFYGHLVPTSLESHNFCVDKETGVVKMSCVEWMAPQCLLCDQ
ncbi:hypothetical protein Pcinc_020673 [Petrolisthes cinctipes]|uniref:Uncharacterized protein n=1 Tax=Petrolisthes cinctipes TaxID=88211 RepID=A0AAE1FHX8_PETCI|nr:hypothetical protein Pcinc_020673 [Petrolisthes cinctipes]